MKKVNFIEAIISGKRFRKVGDSIYMSLASHQAVRIIDKEFILSIFELEEKSITLTESDFYKACKRATLNKQENYVQCLVEILKKELGF